jgi:vacuolar-type H+-ATPase subunit H
MLALAQETADQAIAAANAEAARIVARAQEQAEEILRAARQQALGLADGSGDWPSPPRDGNSA